MATCFSLSFFRSLRKTSPSRSVSGEALCVKAIFDMIRHFSTLFTAVMTDIEDRRQVARIARGEGRTAGPTSASFTPVEWSISSAG